MTELARSSGVQLHLSSLPGGRLGREAYEFVDWLAAAGQAWWQLLPLGPPDRYRSPYKARSAFAAWPGFLGEPRAAVSAAEIASFREREGFWVEDWERFAGRGAIADQVRFEREWAALREYGAARGVRILGDVAIYVAPGSADHRAHPELFQTGYVAGAPPDAYSDTGQLWGNPLYDWPALRRRRYRWWVERLRRTLELFDVARIDHFRGLVSYWAVPEGERTAVHGHWKRGPGRALFDALVRGLGGLPFVAEDLGVITPAVERLRDELGLPGMLVLQFGFGPDNPDGPHRLENHVENRIVYTGTHDHDTARGWYESLDDVSRAAVERACAERGVGDPEPWWRLIRLAFGAPAKVAMIQAQDVLGLGSEARMNQPGRAARAWRWRMEPGALTPALARRLRELTEATGRLS
ncbi:MAG: 4-alpha-glucanotransferase [Solirubrobacterales bacterium]|nr:4-alpha-glucanotransferase [Solirubrobacterales bacterium]MBV9716410.1 4-alpha-glucanotransferase [Solirubrobacterales bacterium]